MNDAPTPKPPVSHLDQLAQRTREAEQQNDQTPEEVAPVEETAEDEVFTIIFDATSANYIPGLDPFNLEFVRTAANSLNHQLQVRGHLFLNEVYDYLGIKRTKAGQSLGWIANDNEPGRISIDVEQDEERFILTPNVQGDILDKI